MNTKKNQSAPDLKTIDSYEVHYHILCKKQNKTEHKTYSTDFG